MTAGPEHYREAEILLGYATETTSNHDETNPAATLLIAQAQVHATLALTAATLAAAYMPESADTEAWQTIVGSPDDYDGMTNADVIGADELHEMDRDAEFAHDAAADALAAEAGDVR